MERSLDNPGFNIGAHTLKFSTELSKQGLYTSFDLSDCCGRVQYFITVEFLFGEHMVVRRKLLFPIVCPTNATDIPATASDSRRTRIEFGKSQYLEANLYIPKRYFVPGESVDAQILIDNQSGKSVKYSHLTINQNVLCIATFPSISSKQWSSDTLGVGLPIDKITSGSTFKYSPNFYIPALVPNFEIDACMKLTYELKLSLGFNRVSFKDKSKNIVCTLKIPIWIGTSSLTENAIFAIEKGKEFGDDLVAPPGYTDDAPPPYDECIEYMKNIDLQHSHHSSITDDEDKKNN